MSSQIHVSNGHLFAVLTIVWDQFQLFRLFFIDLTPVNGTFALAEPDQRLSFTLSSEGALCPSEELASWFVHAPPLPYEAVSWFTHVPLTLGGSV